MTESMLVTEAKHLPIITTVETNGLFQVGDSRALSAAGLMVVVGILIVDIVVGDHGFTCGLKKY